MQTYFTCTMFCLPKSHNQQQVNEEPNAFDLTWRNYLPSTSQLCPCLPIIGRPRQGILLDNNNSTDNNNLLISPPYYNDFYQANAVQGYLGDQNDREFDDLLLANNKLKKTPSGKSKKRSKRKRYPKQRLLPKPASIPSPYYDNEYDDEEDNGYDYHGNNANGYYYDHQQGPIVYEVYSDNEQQDAVYLGDDQIAKMVNNYEPGPGQHEFYAPRTIPFIINDHEDEDYHDNNKVSSIQATSSTDSHQQNDQVTGEPTVTTAALAAQAILSETLEDLTEKLAFIRNNMMDIGSSTLKQHNDNENDNDNDDNDDDTATLHTLKTIVKKRSLDRLSTSSDLDSIASEALQEYENQENHHRPSITTSDYHNRRLSSNIGSDLHMPVPLDSSASNSYSKRSHHPFAYFTEPVDVNEDDNDNNPSRSSSGNNDNVLTSGIQGAVLNFGRKWFG